MIKIERFIERYKLWKLMEEEPELTAYRCAKILNKCQKWCYTWYNRLKEVVGQSQEKIEAVLWGKKVGGSSKKVSQEVEKRIVQFREKPVDDLWRVAGPVTIKAWLETKCEDLREKGEYIPSSTSTIWKILHKYNCIETKEKQAKEPRELEAPLVTGEVDFMTVSGVKDENSDKKQNVVEVLNIVDAGTSMWLKHDVRSDFNMETVIASFAQFFKEKGLLPRLRIDRDPRFIGSWTAKEFPSAFMRFCYVLGVELEICSPKRWDEKPFVERIHRTLREEALARYKPSTVAESIEAFDKFDYHYHHQRPHQGFACQNRPPAVAFPKLPVLRPVPDSVDPDAWLTVIAGKEFSRHIDYQGRFQLGGHTYYVDASQKGRQAVIFIDPPAQELEVIISAFDTYRLPIYGLQQRLLSFDDYCQLIKKEAISEYRLNLAKKARYVPLS